MHLITHVLSVPGLRPQETGALDLQHSERKTSWPTCETNDDVNNDFESIYQSVCEEREQGHRPVLQNIQRLKQHDELFYENVILGGKVSWVDGLHSEQAVLKTPALEATEVVLIGCGGSKTVPSGMCVLEVEVYGCKVVVPMLVVQGQSEDLIIGSNLLRYLVCHLRLGGGLLGGCPTMPGGDGDLKKELLSLVAKAEECVDDVPEKVGFVKIKRAVTLEPMTEHLVWGKLQQVNGTLAGSTIMLVPTCARSRPRSVIVGRTVALLGDDGWLPLKVINPANKPVTLRRNAKLADVHRCTGSAGFQGLSNCILTASVLPDCANNRAWLRDLEDERGAVADASVDSVGYRTRVWVSVLPSETESRVDLEGVDRSEEAVIGRQCEAATIQSTDISVPEIVDQTSHRLSDPDPPMTEVLKTSDGADSGNSLTIGGGSLDHLSGNDNQCLTTETIDKTGFLAGDGEAREGVRSRAGRLLKPVARLIEFMHQRTGS
ncbi:hypothetical protein N1851_021889 [Merluccius polli]|uniref:Uncharacterized protein n=1 Tax=Merluccius polli TaxID=89951 RepID=A0AA47MIU4_MERPO|nr:hypothetical protein N1851_021889 [Merluccius polli]